MKSTNEIYQLVEDLVEITGMPHSFFLSLSLENLEVFAEWRSDKNICPFCGARKAFQIYVDKSKQLVKELNKIGGKVESAKGSHCKGGVGGEVAVSGRTTVGAYEKDVV